MTYPADAPCRGTHPNVFHDPRTEHTARATCSRCPHTGAHGPCVTEGHKWAEYESVRGGLTGDERRKLRRVWRRGRAA